MTDAVELLAPAGEPDAAFAAFQYGADAIYLGLPRFSARAEAANVTVSDLSEIVAFAHSLQPRRRVFVAVNTLVLEAERREAAATLAALADLEVDAVIVQDLGVARMIRRQVPELRLHASTQMAIHSADGVRALKSMGFARATLARELTLEEIQAITAGAGMETEVFIHGALCTSFSGLCLFSSMMRGRSGNRGRCTYPCRDFCQLGGRLRDGLAFSMKDLALTGDVTALVAAGVRSLKIEGRKKSPLYVATVVDYYRKVLDGTLKPGEGEELEARMKTVFSRPWTKLFLHSRREAEVVDRDTVGHRGAPVGTVELVHRSGEGGDAVQFVSERALERHDGLQIDIPGEEKPFGFAVDSLRLGTGRPTRWRPVFEAPAGSLVEVGLPADHPQIPEGATIYCASSQAVKRGYPFDRPRPGAFRVRHAVDVELEVAPDRLQGTLRCAAPGGVALEVSEAATGRFEPARKTGLTGEAARGAFEKLGDTALMVRNLELKNPQDLFVPVSVLNDLRRRLAAALEPAREKALAARAVSIADSGVAALPGAPAGNEREVWSLKLDKADAASTFTADDWRDVREVVVDIFRQDLAGLEAGLAALQRMERGPTIRLALPMIVRQWEREELLNRVARLRGKGFRSWQFSGLAGWSLLGVETGEWNELDITVDWPVYVTNLMAAEQVLELGASGFTLSPEDTRDNMGALLGRYGEAAAVLVYQDTPLFISASCVVANLEGRCRGGEGCREGVWPMQLAGGERVVAIQDRCGTVVVGESPYTLGGRLEELRDLGARHLRADFIWKSYEPDQVRQVWRQLRAGRAPAQGHPGNFVRGLA